MALWLGMFAVLADDPGLVASTHVATCKTVTLVPGDLTFSSDLHRH